MKSVKDKLAGISGVIHGRLSLGSEFCQKSSDVHSKYLILELTNILFWKDGMNSLETEIEEPKAKSIKISDDSLSVDLFDGRTIIVPLLWYPRLWHGSNEERNNFELIDEGSIIHWPDLDEDLSLSGIVAGRKSGESQKSLKRWLKNRENN